jgi:HD-like signal output (HDOD) protein
MVAIKNHEVDRYIAKPDPGFRIVLFYGPDAGLVSERADDFCKKTNVNLTDPFSTMRLNAEDVADDKSRLQDEAFTVGIVHNIGRLLLHLTEPEIAQDIQTLVSNRKAGRVKAELDLLGFTSQDAGKALMDLWKFPSTIGDAVKFHKRPFSDDEPQALPCILNLACYLNACIRNDRDYDLVREGFPAAVAKAAGLSEGIVYELDDALIIGDELRLLLD